MTVTLWHNPRCSKSRETLALLEARGVAPRIRLYLEDAPSAADIREALRLLGVPPRGLMRTKEAEYAAMGLDDPTMGDEALIAALHAAPKLIERPVVFANGKAAIGRPPEAVLEIL